MTRQFCENGKITKNNHLLIT